MLMGRPSGHYIRAGAPATGGSFIGVVSSICAFYEERMPERGMGDVKAICFLCEAQTEELNQ